MRYSRWLSVNASPAADLDSLLSLVAANPATPTVLNAQVMSTAALDASVDTQLTSKLRDVFPILNAPMVKMFFKVHVFRFVTQDFSSSRTVVSTVDAMRDMLLMNLVDASEEVLP